MRHGGVQRRGGICSAWRDWGHLSEEAATPSSLIFTIQPIPPWAHRLSLNHARLWTSHLQAFASLTFSARTSPLTPTPLPDDPLQFPLSLQALSLLRAEPLPFVPASRACSVVPSGELVCASPLHLPELLARRHCLQHFALCEAHSRWFNVHPKQISLENIPFYYQSALYRHVDRHTCPFSTY